MQFDGVAFAIGAIALVAFLIALKLLLNFKWVFGWLRGTIGMSLLALTVVLGFCVLDIRTYQPMISGQPLATLSLEKKAMQQFNLRLVDNNGVESRYALSGDAWKLTANVIDWAPRFYILGMVPGYRFNAFEGKYYSLVMERKKEAEEKVIQNSALLDVWSLLNTYMPSSDLIKTKLAVVPAQAMVDGAQYELLVKEGHLTVRPLNEVARQATAGW